MNLEQGFLCRLQSYSLGRISTDVSFIRCYSVNVKIVSLLLVEEDGRIVCFQRLKVCFWSGKMICIRLSLSNVIIVLEYMSYNDKSHRKTRSTFVSVLTLVEIKIRNHWQRKPSPSQNFSPNNFVSTSIDEYLVIPTCIKGSGFPNFNFTEFIFVTMSKNNRFCGGVVYSYLEEFT